MSGPVSDAFAWSPASRRGFLDRLGAAVSAAACLALLLACPLQEAHAQTRKTWNVTTGDWSTPENWNTSGAPSATTDIAVFGGSGQTLLATGTATPSIGQLIFSNSGTTTISVDRLTLNSGTSISVLAGSGPVIIDGTSAGGGVSSALYFPGNTVWENNSSSLMSVQTTRGVIFPTASGTITIQGSGPVSIGAVQRGTIQYSGSSTLTLAAAMVNDGNQYPNLILTSGTVMNAVGTQNLTAGNSGAVVFGGGALGQVGSGMFFLAQAGGEFQYNGNLSFVSGTMTLSKDDTTQTTGHRFNAPLTIDTLSNTRLVIAGGGMFGTSRVTKSGAGVLQLESSTSGTGFSGGWTLSQGELRFGGAGTQLGTGTFVINGGTISSGTGATAITLTDAAPQNWANDFSVSGSSALTMGTGAVTLTASPVVTVTAPTFTIRSAIGGNFGLTKGGTGVFVLSAANTFSGTTSVSSGTLRLDNSLALQNSVLDTSGAGAVALTTGSLTAGGLTLGGLTGSGSVASVIASGYSSVSALTLNPQAGNTYTYSGVIANGASGMTLTKTGAGVQVLSGNNTFSGQTTISEGTLSVGAIGNGGANSPLGTDTTVNVGGTAATPGILRYAGPGETTSRVFNLVASGTGGIEANGSGPIVISSTVTAAGSGRFLLAGTNTGSNQIARINGTGVAVDKDGPGSWWFTGTSGFTGNFRVLDGTAVVSANVAISGNSPVGAGSLITVGGTAASGEASLSLFNANIDRNVTVASGAGQRVLLGLAANATTGTFQSNSNLTLNREVTLVAPNGGAVRFANSWATNNNNVRIGTSLYTGTVQLSGANKATTTGTVSVEFGQLNVISGSLTAGQIRIQDASELKFDSTSALTSPLAFTGSNGILSGTGNVRVTTVDVTGTGHRISANVVGTGTFTKTGLGTVALTGTNTYSGATTINAGVLQIGNGGTTGSVASASSITGSSGATLVFNRSDNYGGAFANTIGGGLAVTQAGSGTLTLTGSSTYTGTTSVTAGVLQIGNGGAAGSVDGTGGLVLGSARLVLNRSDAFTETFNNTVIAGAASVAANSNNTLNFGTLTFQPGASLAIAATGSFITSSPNVNGILPSTVFGGTTWAVAGSEGAPITGLTSYTLTTNAGNAPANYADANVDVNNSPSPSAAITPNTLRFSSAAANTLSLTGANSVAAGVLVTPGVGANVSTISGGSLSASGDFAVLQNNTSAALVIGSSIVDGSPGMSFSASGPGTVTLTGVNTYTGTTNVGGVLQIGNGGTAGSIASTAAVTGVSGASLVFNRSDNYGGSFASPITGGLAVTLAGSGTLTLTGSNTYTGTTSVNAGVLQVGAGGTAGSIASPAITGSSGGTIVFNRSDNYGGSFATPITGGIGLTQAGSGTLTLTGNYTFTGPTTVNAGGLQIGNGGTVGSIASSTAITGSSGGTLVFNRSDSYGGNYAAAISGGLALTQAGSGTLTLTGNNTFTGPTRVVAGQLTVGGSLALQSSTLDLAASDTGAVSFSQNSTIGGVQGSRSLDLGTRTVSVGNNGSSTTYSGALSNGSLTKVGAGTLTLTGSNTLTAPTTVSGGTLAIGSGGTAGSIAGNVSTAANAAIAFNRSDAVTYSGTISGGGGLVKQGAGTLTLSASNTYTGPTTVSAGTLVVPAAGPSLPSQSEVRVDAAGTLSLGQASNSNSFVLNGGTLLSAARGSVINEATVTGGSYTIAGNNLVYTFTTVGSGSLSVPASTAGAQVLVVGGGGGGGGAAGGGGGGGGVVYIPNITLSGGYSVTVGNGGAGGSGGDRNRVPGVSGTASTFLNSSGTVTAAGGGGGGGLNVSAGGTGLPGGSGGGAGTGNSIPFISGGAASGSSLVGIFANTGTAYGSRGGNVTSARGSEIVARGGGGAGVTDPATLDGPGNPNPPVGGAGGIGVQINIAGNNYFWGGGGGGASTINTTAGLGGNGGSGGGGGGGGASATLSGTGGAGGLNAGSNALSTGVGGAGGANTGGGGGGGGGVSFNEVGGNGGSGIVIVSYPAVYGPGTLTLTGPIRIDATSTLDDAGGAIVAQSTMSGLGGIIKSGAGTLTLSGSNTFSGNTSINAGQLLLSNTFALGQSTFTGGAGTLSFGSLTAATFGGLSGSSNVALSNTTSAAVALTVGANDQSTTYSGILSGAGGLTKTGTGRLSLTGQNSYTGNTVINSGTLLIGVANAISGSSAITIGSAGSRGFMEIDHPMSISNLTFTGQGGDIVDGSDGTATFSSTTGTAVITVLGGTNNNFHANAVLSSPTVVNVSDGALFTFHNNLSGGASLTKSGSGTMQLVGDNDLLSGNLFITGGRVNIGAGMSQIGTGTTTLSNGAILDLNGQSFTNIIDSSGGTILNNGAASTTTITGPTVVSSTASLLGTYEITSTGSARFEGVLGNGSSLVTVRVGSGSGSGAQAVFANAVSGSGSVTVYGASTFDSTVSGYVISHGTSTFNGNLLTGGEVGVRSGGSALFSGTTVASSKVEVDAGGVAEFRSTVGGIATVSGSALFTSAAGITGSLTTNPGGVATLDNVVGSAITGLIHSDGTLNIVRTSGSETISAVIEGSGELVKQGAGQVTLTGNNPFSGVASVNAGTLAFDRVAALGSSSDINIAGGSVLDYTGSAGTLSPNVTVSSSGTGTIRNSGGQTLTLAGTLTKNGRVLRLTGGSFNVTGQIVGANANSDLLVDGTSTVTLSSTNSYNGPTFVNQASTLIIGVNNAIPSNSVVTLGDATTRGTLDLGGNSNAIGQLVFSGSGGTVKMAANQTASPQVGTSASLTLGSNASLDLTGMQTAAGNYRLISSTGITGTFGSVTGLNSNYVLRYGTVNANEISAQRKAEFGTITATPASATIITGGSTAFSYTVTNATPTGGSTLSFTSSNGANITGASSGTALAGGTSASISGLVFTGTNVGLSETGSFTLTDADAIGSPANASVTVNVLNHSLASFSGTSVATKTLDFGTYNNGSWTGGDGGNGTLGYSIFNIASLGFSNAETAGLNFYDWAFTSGDNVFDLGLSSLFTNLASGSSSGFSATVLSPGSLANGSYSATYTLKFQDQQDLSGAANTRDLTLTMNLIIVPEPGTLALAGLGIATAVWAVRRRYASKKAVVQTSK